VNDSDAIVWERILDGDTSALADLFDRHEKRLFLHATRLLTTREDAKDAVAIAFFELWRKRRSVRIVDGSPLPWLLNTTALVARNLERSARRYRVMLSRVDPRPETVEVRGADESGVLAALRTLSDRDQSVLVLTVLEGYSERETATVLGVPPGTVKSRLARAKARLRTEIEGWN
jgi:RNA polymerase sigma factor (sigma-70 family)